MDTKQQYQYEGIKWIMEMELLNHPQAINTIKLNILSISPGIKEVELLIHREQKSILILVQLSWFTRTFRKKQVFSEIYELMTQLIPSFKFRVTEDQKIMEMAVNRVKQALGGKYETKDSTNVINNVNQSNSENSNVPSTQASSGSNSNT